MQNFDKMDHMHFIRKLPIPQELKKEMPLTPELAAQLLRLEGSFTRVLLNQADTPERAQLGENMAAMLGCPVCIGSLQRGILKCLY